MNFIGLAGIPTVHFSGSVLETTAPAPIMVCLPISN
jgi:hypothetical protein